MGGVALLVEVNLGDPVVVDRQRLAEGVLRDLQPPVHVAAERRGEMKPDGERQIRAA